MLGGIVKKYLAVFVFALLIVIMGLVSYISLPRESAPEIRRPLIFITTVYPGVSPKDIESLITEEIEAELEGLEGLDKLKSTSQLGVSMVTAEFSGDTDVELALRRTKERVDIAKSKLPLDAEDPVVRELNFSDQPFLIITISNPDGLERIETLVDDLEDQIKKIQGVLDVLVTGKLHREVEIAIDPTLLSQYGFSLSDVGKAIRNENITIPGGELKSDILNFSVTVSGEISDPEEFKSIVVKSGDRQIPLKNLGNVSFRYSDLDSYSTLNGKPAISLAVKKRSGENLIELVENIKKVVANSEEEFPPETVLDYTYDESENIKSMVLDLENNILSALCLVLIVTLFFLGLVNALFVSLAIPFSMLMSFFVLSLTGITLNMVVLFSLVIALGMLVDNGIVIVENIYRHAAMGKSRIRAALDGTREVAWPIATSTATTVLAFFPIVFMPGIMGEFMSYLPKTVIIVLVSSLFVGLTITMTFCARFLSISEENKRRVTEGGGGFQKLQKIYRKSLESALSNTKRSLGVLAAITIFVFAGIILNGMFGKETVFFPSLDPRVGVVSVKLPNGTPLEKNKVFSSKIEERLNGVPASAESIQTSVGARSGAGSGRDSHRTQIRITFKPFVEREIPSSQSLQDMRKAVASIPGAEIKVTKLEGGPPKGNDISYDVTGQDYRQLGAIAAKIEAIINKYSDKFDLVDSDFEAAKPEIKVIIDREKANRLGFNTRLIASTIRTAISGSKESTIRRGKEEYDVMLRLTKEARDQLSFLRDLEIVKDGKRIPLSTFAHIERVSSVNVIKRSERLRTVSVFADFLPEIDGKEQVKKEIDEAVHKISVPHKYDISSGQGQEVRQESTEFLIQAFIVAIFLIFLVMVIQFNSVAQPMIILVAVFLSLGGVFWGLLIFRQTFVIIMSGIGVISLAGVVVNNAIVLIDFINQLVLEGKPLKNAVLEAAETRLRPVLLTAITTVIGLLPMAYGISFNFFDFSIQFGSESSEWWAPMAWTIIYGLSFATILTLFVVPTLTYLSYIARGVGAEESLISDDLQFKPSPEKKLGT